ncbi:hypothetical protein HRbin15_01124 [bacterium HR15]|nr:hypothetical protein HRbin15_01124 [bacterium HR15]
MFGKAQWVVREHQTLRPPSPEGEARHGSLAVEESSEYIVLPGQCIEFSISNSTNYPRWYQVVVTNLYPTEYSLYSNLEVVSTDELIELGSNESRGFTLLLVSDPEHPRTTPCPFEIVVTEYWIPDTTGQGEIYFLKEYQLVPPVNAQSIKIDVHPKIVLARPWHRTVRIEVSVTNHSYLPVDAQLRLNILDNKGKPLPLDDGGEQVLDMGRLDGWQRQSVVCRMPLEQRLQEPLRVLPVVEATVRANGERIRRQMERHIHIVPMPFLKTWWPDWIIAGVVLMLLIGILFGFPPIYRPEARIRLHFEGLPEGQLPPGLMPRDLKVTVEITDTKGIKRPYPCLYRLYTDGTRTGVEFYKRWPWEKRGLRFLWTALPLSLKIEPDPKRDQTGHVSAKLKPYDLEQLQVDPNWMVDPAEPGVVPPLVIVTIPRRERLEVPVHLPAGWPKEDTEVTVEARINGAPCKEGPKKVSLSGGHPTQPIVSFDLTGQVEKGSEATLEIIARSDIRGHQSSGRAKVRSGLPPPPVKLGRPVPYRPEYSLSVSSKPPGATVYLDGQAVGVTPYEGFHELPSGKKEVAILLKLDGYENYETHRSVRAGGQLRIDALLKPLKTSSSSPPPTPTPHPPDNQSDDRSERIRHWLALLNSLNALPLFEQGGKLKVYVKIVPLRDKNIILTVFANQPCWVQVYQCDTANGKREPLLGWDDLRGKSMLYPKRRSPPLHEALERLDGRRSSQMHLMLESEGLEFVAIAMTQLPPSVERRKEQKGGIWSEYALVEDSLKWIASIPSGGQWAINGASGGGQ